MLVVKFNELSVPGSVHADLVNAVVSAIHDYTARQEHYLSLLHDDDPDDYRESIDKAVARYQESIDNLESFLPVLRDGGVFESV